MSRIKLIVIALGCMLALFIGAFVQYYLPSTARVRITGTEVKRLDVGEDTKSGQPITRDVRFIFAIDKDSKRDRVFRNEDTGWGWPPYLKFDSGNFAVRAINIKEASPNDTVLVTYYGWRITFLDLYPNAVGLRVVPDDYYHVPYFNLTFFATIIALLAYGVYWIRYKRRRSRE